ncbi:hypothetical protein HUS90_35540, partial [Pseudomonas protegens]|nr:hypothetical protein [Pseudomonas protegens]
IWTMPSLAEGLGLALLEGMSGQLPVLLAEHLDIVFFLQIGIGLLALGGQLPVIASNVPAMLPLIEGAGGLAVEPANVSALVTALDAYLGLSDEELAAKGQQAYAYLQKEHDIEVFREEYRQLIDSGLSQAGKRQ